MGTFCTFLCLLYYLGMCDYIPESPGSIFGSVNQSIILFCPRAGLSLQTQHSPVYPLLSIPFRILIQSIYNNVVYHLTSSAANFHPIYHSFSMQFLLSQWPSQFLFLFLSVSTLFFPPPLFLAQLHFFCPFYALHPSPYPHLECF